MRANSHIIANFAVADAIGLQLFGFRADEEPSISLVQACHKGQITLRQHIRRRISYHIMSFEITRKVTKNPPDFQIYLTDIQHINYLFCIEFSTRKITSFLMIGIMTESNSAVA